MTDKELLKMLKNVVARSRRSQPVAKMIIKRIEAAIEDAKPRLDDIMQ